MTNTPDEPAGRESTEHERVDREAGDRVVPAYVDKLAWVLDDWIKIPVVGKRIGVDGAIGMVPGLGDGAGLVASAVIILSAVRDGVSLPTLARMVGNVLI